MFQLSNYPTTFNKLGIDIERLEETRRTRAQSIKSIRISNCFKISTISSIMFYFRRLRK